LPVDPEQAAAGPIIAGTGNPLTVTTCVVVAGPLHPAALAVIVVVPLQVGTYVTDPVAATIVFPPAKLVASKL
jgi:hypothetical protein